MGYGNQIKESEFAVRNELSKARDKFPSNKQMLHAFVEEAGEGDPEFPEYEGWGSEPY